MDNATYRNVAELVDWDSEVEEWSEPVMGLWPFGCSIPGSVCIHRECIMVIDDLISFLDNQEMLMDGDYDDVVDDDDDDDESSDDGYVTDEDSDSDNDNINFG